MITTKVARMRLAWLLGGCFGLLSLLNLALAQSPCADSPPSLPQPLTLVRAVSFALQNNPELMAIRQQHGIAAAGVVIARTYPFNPVLENRVQGAAAPASAGITNQVPLEYLLLFEVEVRGQGNYRRQQALAALSRTDWEIAEQEERLAVQVIRSFEEVLYRREKQKLIQETIDLARTTVQQLSALLKANSVTQADLIVARSEEDDALAQLGTGRSLVAAAEYNLRRGLGLVGEPLQVQGAMEAPERAYQTADLLEEASEHRGDLRARQVAVSEADAKLRLTIADRYGNPIMGPAYTYDNTRVSEIGVQLNIPLPVFNRRRGEIQQREAERALAAAQLRQTELAVQQDVRAALERLQHARETASSFSKQTLPNLRAALKEMQDLFDHNRTDVVRFLEVRRKLLKARDSYLDALLEVRQALADLAAAIGETGPALPEGSLTVR
jgi:outer membrane protein TolC